MFHVKRNQTLDPSNFGEEINKTNTLLRMFNQHLHNKKGFCRPLTCSDRRSFNFYLEHRLVPRRPTDSPTACQVVTSESKPAVAIGKAEVSSSSQIYI